MGKPGARSVLYRVIEAGQLARLALSVPLNERGLAPGDDALLFLLHDNSSATEADLVAALGVGPAVIAPWVERLSRRDLIRKRASETGASLGLELTERGERLAGDLAANWDRIERAMLGGLRKRGRKRLRRALGRVVQALRPSDTDARAKQSS